MRIQEIYDDLVFGELSSHGIAINGSISDADKPKIISAMNSGLADIYTRFPLLTKEITIIQHSFITEYHLDVKYARTNTASTEKYKYIYDTPSYPFIGDNLRVENIYDEVGNELLINSNSTCSVALFPSMNTIEIPNPVETNAMFVVYRAKHPTIKADSVELHTSFPQQFRNALLAFIGSRVYAGGTAQEHVAKSQEFMQKYLMELQQLEVTGMANMLEEHLNCKPIHGGWV